VFAPLQSRATPSLPLMIPLTTLPIQTFTLLEGSTPHFSLALISVFTHILTIPSLLYRIPVLSLTHLSSEIPFANLPLLDFTPFTSGSVSGEEKVHLITTLHALAPPRYQKLEADALVAYLRLLTLLLNATPVSARAAAAGPARNRRPCSGARLGKVWLSRMKMWCS
jgi:ubiquitin-protein ligase E3 C